MIKAYINYPNPHITVHSDSACGNIKSQNKPDQRYCRINSRTISDELKKFQKHEYRFGATPSNNDIWLEIDFENQAFEMAIVEYVCHLLGKHYSPFARVKPERHC
jgi:hypothetical protein